MAKYFITETEQILYRTMIELGGGRFRGIQKGDAELGLSPLILFDGPSLSTLCLRPEQVSAARVRSEIAKKEAEFEAFAEKAAIRVFSQFAQRAAA